MASVSADVGVNIGHAESSIAKVLNGLKQLRDAQAKLGGGVHLFAPDELKNVQRALAEATAAATNFHRVNAQGLTGLTTSSQQFVRTLQQNLTQYQRNLGSMGATQTQARVNQWAQQGGNPLAPNFGQLFPNVSGSQLHAQQTFYWQQMLRGTGFGVGGAGHGGQPPGAGGVPATGAPPPAPLRDNSLLDGVLNSSLIGKVAALALGGGVAAAVMKGVAYTQERNEARDVFMRQTRDFGGPLDLLTKNIETAAVAIGQSGNEAIKTAGIWSKAAYQSDPWKIDTGYRHAAGFARSYGLDINGTTNTLGGLARYGVGGGNDAEQTKFALKLGQVIRDGGMTQAPQQVLEDLLTQATQHGNSTFTTMPAGEQDAYLRLRMATYGNPALQGAAGQGLINSVNTAIGSDGDLAKELFNARALSQAGVTNLYAQRFARKSGMFFDLGEVGGKRGTTVMDARMESFDQEYGHRPLFEQYTAFGYLNTLSEPQAKVYLDLARTLKKERKQTLGGFANDLQGRYGVDLATMNTGGINEIIKAMGARPEELPAMAKRYVDKMGLLSGTQKQPITDALAGGNAEAIRTALVKTMATHGIEKTEGQKDRMTDAEYAKALGDTVGDKINPALRGIKEVAAGGLNAVDASVQAVITQLKTLADIADPNGTVRESLAQRAGDYVNKAITDPMEIRTKSSGEVREIIGRHAQGARGRAMDAFRGAGSAVLDFFIPPAGGAELPGGGTYPYQSEIEAAAARHGVPAEALAGVIARESRFGQVLIGDHDNSWGMGHLNRHGGAAELGRTREQILSMSPAEQIDDVARFLRMNIDRAGGDVDAGVKRYNGGGDPNYLRNVRERQREYGIGGSGAVTTGNRLRFDDPSQNALDPNFRAALERAGQDLRITSGRAGRANTPGSMHPLGRAADISMAGMDTKERAAMVRRLRAAGVLRFGTYDRYPNMLHVDNSTAQGGNWYMHNKTARQMDQAPEWFSQVSREQLDREGAYVPGIGEHLAAQAGRGGDRYGELTLNINQRVNGQTRGSITQRLKAGSGVDRPRHHGDVDLAAFP